MTDKEFRNDAIKRGLTVLRPQHDGRRNCYKIVKLTRNSGWSRFGGNWYITREDAARKIDELVSMFPNQYIKDQNNERS